MAIKTMLPTTHLRLLVLNIGGARIQQWWIDIAAIPGWSYVQAQNCPPEITAGEWRDIPKIIEGADAKET